MLRRRLHSPGEIQRQLAQKGAKVLELLGAGTLVNPKKRRLLQRLKELRRGDVGNQHALFDQLVGAVAMHRLDGCNLALFIKQDAGFLRFKVERTALLTRTSQHLIEPE